MAHPLDAAALEQAFLKARTFNKFLDQEIPDEVILQLYDLMKWGPTAMNCQSGHLLVIKSPEAKQRLLPSLMPGNREKTQAAPATIIVASDTRFYENLPTQFPANPRASELFDASNEMTQQTAFRNSTLQGAYLMIAARMLGLDCGPMSGFNNAAIDKEFFPEGRYRSNFLINIGYGDPTGNYPRGPRLPFDQAVAIL